MIEKFSRLLFAIIVLAILAWFIYEVIVFLPRIFDSRPDADNPGYLFNYQEQGTYTFDSRYILDNLDNPEDNIFTLFTGNPDDSEFKYKSIVWKQSDYLKVANAVSLLAWGEPLDLENWYVYSVKFRTDCADNNNGFDVFDITYY